MAQIQITEIKNKGGTYSLINADRPLDSDETDALENAVKLTKLRFKAIPPVQGTLAYTFRNLAGGNAAVIEFIKYAASDNRTKFVRNILIWWNSLDPSSQKRIDVFDWFCEKFNVSKAKFWGVVQEGLFQHEEAMKQISLSGYTPEFIELVKRMAGKEKNTSDRALMADMLKLKEDKPLVNLQQNINNTKNELHQHLHVEKAAVPSFLSSIKRGDEGIRREVTTEVLPPKSEIKQLSEGEQNYIDAEIITKETKKEPEFVENVMEDEDFEEQMRRSAANL